MIVRNQTINGLPRGQTSAELLRSIDPTTRLCITCNKVSKMPKDVKAFLASKKTDTSDLDVAQKWAEIEDLYTKRLWHQLTVCLLDFVKHECFKDGGLLEVYDSFLSDFEHKINPVSLVEMILVITKEVTDSDEAVAMLERTKEKVKNDTEAKVLCMTAIGFTKLQCGNLEEVKALIEEADVILDAIAGVSPAHARYYDLCSKFYKVKGNHAAYYRDALRFLGCVDIEDIPVEEQMDRAFTLALAALLGENVYNFGELLAHPVLKSLKETSREWIVTLLYAFNAGNLHEYESLRSSWEQQPDLEANQSKLRGKIQLLSVMELVFTRHAHDRTITFSAIAKAAESDINQVELLMMKALSLGLVKGTIDEVNQEVNMTWVQPRVLDLHQVSGLQCRMSNWYKQINGTISLVKGEVPDVVLQ